MNPMDMIKKIREFQQRLGEIKASGSAGGGLVEVTLNGSFEMVALKIDPSVLSPEDRDLVADLVVAASRQAHASVKLAMERELGSMGIPPGMLQAMGGLGA